MKENGVWRTVGGRRIFIKEGQDLAEAMKESGKFSKQEVSNDKKVDRDTRIKELTKEIEEMENGTTEKEVLGVIAKNGKKLYIGPTPWSTTPKIERALTAKNQNGIEYQKELEKKGWKIDNEVRAEKKPFSFAKYSSLQEELQALKSGFDNVADYKANQEKVKQDYISSKKKKLENSYIYSQKTKDMKPYDNFYEYDNRDSTLYNTDMFEEVIKRKAKQLMNIEEVHHSAKSGASKFSSSIYLKNKDNDIEVRISNHYLPETAEREYNRSLHGGETRWDKELVLTQNVMEDIASLKTKKEFDEYLKDLFS